MLINDIINYINTTNINTMSKVITILGPDRVGKSTLCSFLGKYASTLGLSSEVVHFSGPKPWHHTPIDQYTEALDFYIGKRDIIICDRGSAEVCFYESFRRNNHIEDFWAVQVEDYINSKTEKNFTFLIKRSWEWSKIHHIDEIKALFPDCTDFWLDRELETRSKEHIAYYLYMQRYFMYISKISPIILPDNYLSVEHLSLIFCE